jgi:hypothetical protein
MLFAVGQNMHHAAARICSPNAAIALSKNALGALQVAPDKLNRVAINLPIFEWIHL